MIYYYTYKTTLLKGKHWKINKETGKRIYY